jgi:flagellar biosynthesis regulator FlbT
MHVRRVSLALLAYKLLSKNVLQPQPRSHPARQILLKVASQHYTRQSSLQLS